MTWWKSPGLALLVLMALAIFALGLTGCPVLMIGSLGYEGYKYHETGRLPGMPAQTNHSSKGASPQPTPSSSQYE
jgi:hypothetical protein